MAAPNNNGTTPRDPLGLIRGDPSLDAVWRDVLQGDSTAASRAALIRHYRAQREQFLTKEAVREEK